MQRQSSILRLYDGPMWLIRTHHHFLASCLCLHTFLPNKAFSQLELSTHPVQQITFRHLLVSFPCPYPLHQNYRMLVRSRSSLFRKCAHDYNPLALRILLLHSHAASGRMFAPDCNPQRILPQTIVIRRLICFQTFFRL